MEVQEIRIANEIMGVTILNLSSRKQRMKFGVEKLISYLQKQKNGKISTIKSHTKEIIQKNCKQRAKNINACQQRDQAIIKSFMDRKITKGEEDPSVILDNKYGKSRINQRIQRKAILFRQELFLTKMKNHSNANYQTQQKVMMLLQSVLSLKQYQVNRFQSQEKSRFELIYQKDKHFWKKK